MTTRRGFFGMLAGLAACPWPPKNRGVSYRVRFTTTPRPDTVRRYIVRLKPGTDPSELIVDRIFQFAPETPSNFSLMQKRGFIPLTPVRVK